MTEAAKYTGGQFIEVSMPCSNIHEQEAFWTGLFDAKVIFRGRMNGWPFTRIIVAGVSLVFREEENFEIPPGPDDEFNFCRHLGIRVADLNEAIENLKARGAKFVLTPDDVRQLQERRQEDGRPLLEVDYIAPPLNATRITEGEFKHDVAILVGPDNLWVELNQIKQPVDAPWYPKLPVESSGLKGRS